LEGDLCVGRAVTTGALLYMNVDIRTSVAPVIKNL